MIEEKIFKEGDRVWSTDYNWGTITEVIKDEIHIFPIRVEFSNGITERFTRDGRSSVEKNRSLFHQEMELVEKIYRYQWVYQIKCNTPILTKEFYSKEEFEQSFEHLDLEWYEPVKNTKR